MKRAVVALLQGKPSNFITQCANFLDMLRRQKSAEVVAVHSSLKAIKFNVNTDPARLHIALLQDVKESVCTLNVVRVNGFPEGLKNMDGLTKAWQALSVVAAFSIDPSSEKLSEFLAYLKDEEILEEVRKIQVHLPWPIVNVVKACVTLEDVLSCQSRILRGEFGNPVIWTTMEHHWATNGISIEDLARFGAGAQNNRDIASLRVPDFWRYSISHGEGVHAFIHNLIAVLRDYNCLTALQEMMPLLQFSALGLGDQSNVLTLGESIWFLNKVIESGDRLSLQMLAILSSEIWKSETALNLIDKLCDKVIFYRDREGHIELDLVIEAYNSNPSRRGILYLITLLVGLNKLGGQSLTILNEEAFAPRGEDSKLTLMAVFLLAETVGREYDMEFALQIFCDGENAHVGDVFATFAARENFWRQMRVKFFTSAIATIGGMHADIAEKIRNIMRKDLNAMRSNLVAESTWISDLQLPPDAYAALRLTTKG